LLAASAAAVLFARKNHNLTVDFQASKLPAGHGAFDHFEDLSGIA